MQGPGVPVVNLTEVNNSISNLNIKLNNHWQSIYPVGSVYMSLNSTSPATLFGGTWEQLKDRFLIGSGGTYSNASTGGDINHTHDYGLVFGAYYGSVGLENSTSSGLLTYDTNNNYSISTPSSNIGSADERYNSTIASSDSTKSCSHYRIIANTSYDSTLPPYLAVYMWKRTA